MPQQLHRVPVIRGCVVRAAIDRELGPALLGRQRDGCCEVTTGGDVDAGLREERRAREKLRVAGEREWGNEGRGRVVVDERAPQHAVCDRPELVLDAGER